MSSLSDIRMANLYANVAQLSRDDEIGQVFDMVGQSAARQLGVPHGLAVGKEATIILLATAGPTAAVREVGRVVAGWKGGRQSFHNGHPQIHKPNRHQSPANEEESPTAV